MPLINCEIELDLSRSKEFIISVIQTTPRITVDSNANTPVQEITIINTTGANK